MNKSEAREFAFACARIFLFTGVPATAALLTGFWVAPDWQAQKAILASAALGGAAAGCRAVWGAIRSGQLPFSQFGK